MTTTPEERAEISRCNSLKSTGPRSPQGKQRSKLNAVKHGLTAATPVLPGEDPEAFQTRVGDWTNHLAPRNPVEQFLVEQAATASWKIERADRVESARLAAIMRSVPDELARRQQEEAAALGRRLIGESGEASPARLDDALLDDPLLGFVSGGLKPAPAGVLNHAEAIVLRLESTAAGCMWLLGRWAALRKTLEGGETWDMGQLVEAVRLLGQHPLAQSTVGWEKLHDKLMACEDPELEENCRRTLACQLDSSGAAPSA